MEDIQWIAGGALLASLFTAVALLLEWLSRYAVSDINKDMDEIYSVAFTFICGTAVMAAGVLLWASWY